MQARLGIKTDKNLIEMGNYKKLNYKIFLYDFILETFIIMTFLKKNQYHNPLGK